MPAIALLIPVAALLAAMVLLSLQQSHSEWVRALLDGITGGAKGASLLGYTTVKLLFGVKVRIPYLSPKGAALTVMQYIAKATVRMTKAVGTLLGYYAGARLAALARWFHGLEWVINSLAHAISGLAEDTAEALAGLRNDWIPARIEAAIAPVRRTATNAWNLAGDVDDRLTAASTQLRAKMQSAGFGAYATLGNALAGLVNVTEDLHAMVWRTVWPRVQYITGTALPAIDARLDRLEAAISGAAGATVAALAARVGAIEDAIAGPIDGAIADLRARVKAIEDALAGVGDTAGDFLRSIASPAAFAAAAVAAVAAAAPSLFCRNTRSVTDKVCGMDEALLQAALTGALFAAIALDPRALARAGQEAAELIEPIIRDTAGV